MKTVRMLRVVLGFLVAALWLPVFTYLQAPTPADEFFARAPLVLTVPLTLFVAVPMFLMLKQHASFLVCVLSGAVVGAIGALLFMLVTHWEAGINWAPALVGCGVISSVLFWVVAIWRSDVGHHAV